MKKTALKPAPKKTVKQAAAKQPRAVAISLNLQPEILVAVDALARESGMTRSSLIQMAIARLLKTGL